MTGEGSRRMDEDQEDIWRMLEDPGGGCRAYMMNPGERGARRSAEHACTRTRAALPAAGARKGVVRVRAPRNNPEHSWALRRATCVHLAQIL